MAAFASSRPTHRARVAPQGETANATFTFTSAFSFSWTYVARRGARHARDARSTMAAVD